MFVCLFFVFVLFLFCFVFVFVLFCFVFVFVLFCFVLFCLCLFVYLFVCLVLFSLPLIIGVEEADKFKSLIGHTSVQLSIQSVFITRQNSIRTFICKIIPLKLLFMELQSSVSGHVGVQSD